MHSHKSRWKQRATAGRAIAVCIVGVCVLVAAWTRVQRLGADETPATAAPSADSFRGRLVTDWVAELRDGPVKELVEAGPEALIVWEQAARDAEAVTWVDHCLQVHFRDAPWVATVYVAMLDSPGFLHRTFALLHLQSNPTARREAAPQVVRKARQWAQSGNADTIQGLIRAGRDPDTTRCTRFTTSTRGLRV